MKILKLACLSLLALTATGCGKKVFVPEKTIVAAYVDLEKAYKNGTSFANTLIEALSSEKRKLTKKYDEGLKKIDKIVDNLNPEWAVVAFDGDLKSLARAGMFGLPNMCAVAVKIDADKDAVKKVLKDVLKIDDFETDKKNGNDIFELPMGGRVGLIDDQFLIISPSKDAFDDMFDLYAGKGKASDEFGDLSKISGNTICRIKTAPVFRLLERFELRREIEKFGEVSEDEELANTILNMGSLSLDVDMGDEVGLAVHVACDSSSDAKIIENLMRGVAFLARVGCDFGAFGAENPAILDNKFGRRKATTIIKAKDIFVNLAKNIEADRSWSVATLSATLETEKIADFIRKRAFEDAKVKSSRYDGDDHATKPKDKKPSLSSGFNINSRIDATRALINNVDLAVKVYNMKRGRYPDSIEELTRARPEDEELLLEEDSLDPWGNKFKYEKNGKKRPKITSAGPDGEFDTYDDITNFDAKKKF